MNDLICWHDSAFKPLGEVSISPLDFGFIHSDATYDVLRVKNKQIMFQDLHLTRFKNSCEYFQFAVDFDVIAIARELIEKNNIDNAFLWVACWRGTPPSGSPRDTNAPQHSLVYVKPYYGISSQGLKLCINRTYRRTPDDCHNQEYKNFGWIEFNLAQRDAVANNFDSALLLSVDDYIAEGPGFGVCFVKDGVVSTPARDCLRSVTVDVVERLCAEHRIEFVRTDISVDAAIAADECFICSTSGGITPVNQLNLTLYSHTTTNKLKEYYDSL